MKTSETESSDPERRQSSSDDAPRSKAAAEDPRPLSPAAGDTPSRFPPEPFDDDTVSSKTTPPRSVASAECGFGQRDDLEDFDEARFPFPAATARTRRDRFPDPAIRAPSGFPGPATIRAPSGSPRHFPDPDPATVRAPAGGAARRASPTDDGVPDVATLDYAAEDALNREDEALAADAMRRLDVFSKNQKLSKAEISAALAGFDHRAFGEYLLDHFRELDENRDHEIEIDELREAARRWRKSTRDRERAAERARAGSGREATSAFSAPVSFPFPRQSDSEDTTRAVSPVCAADEGASDGFGLSSGSENGAAARPADATPSRSRAENSSDVLRSDAAKIVAFWSLRVPVRPRNVRAATRLRGLSTSPAESRAGPVR